MVNVKIPVAELYWVWVIGTLRPMILPFPNPATKNVCENDKASTRSTDDVVLR